MYVYVYILNIYLYMIYYQEIHILLGVTCIEADITSKNQQKVKRFTENFEMVQRLCVELEAKDHIRNWQPPISGEIIMSTFNLAPSKPVGVIKDAIRNAILDGIIPNDYDSALAFMHEKAREIGVSA